MLMDENDEGNSESPRSRSAPRSISQSEQSEKIVEETKSTKLLRDPLYLLQILVKGDFIIKADSKELYKITAISGEGDVNDISITAKGDKTTQIINIKNINEYTVFMNIKIILVNYLNRVFKINFPVLINKTLEMIRTDFCKTYNCSEQAIAVIYKNKRLPKKELEKFQLAKDYDLENDELIFIQAKVEPCKFYFDKNWNNPYLGNVKHKYVMIVNSPINLTTIFLGRGYPLKANSFEILEIDESPSKYNKNPRKKELIDQLEFKSLFNREKIENSVVVYSQKDFEIERPDDREASRNEPGYGHKAFGIDPEIKVSNSKVYLMKYDIQYGESPYSVRMDATRKMFHDEKSGVKFSFFLDSACSQYLLIGGFEYYTSSDFDQPEK